MTVTMGDEKNYGIGRINSLNNIVVEDDYIYTIDYIPVNAGSTITWYYSNGTTNTRACLCVYDANKALLSYTAANDSAGYKEYTIPTNGAYIRATFWANYVDQAKILVNDVEVYRPLSGTPLINSIIVIKDGKPYFAQAGYANADGCVALIAPTTTSGPLHIQFNLLEEILGWPYVDFENISVSYANVWRRHLDDPLTDNITEYEIGNGFTETLEQSNKLTTQRPEFPNQITSEQIGWGLVLDDSLQPVMKLYGNKYPEEALADRMKDHYSVSKKRITAQLRSRGGLFSPLHLHAPGSGSGMVCLSQRVQWRDDIVEASLFEI